MTEREHAATSPFAALDAGRPPWDALGAFVPAPQPRIAGREAGPLAGLRFAAKDIFDVAGFVNLRPMRSGAHRPTELLRCRFATAI